MGEVLVSTDLGDIKGTTMLSRDGKKFNAYLGVPYAEPPIGELRLEVGNNTLVSNIFKDLPHKGVITKIKPLKNCYSSNTR